MPRNIIVITGPTASGKSDAAGLIQDLVGCVVIVNADSKQVYAEVPVITDQPNYEGPDLLYGYVSLRERYSVAKWLHDISIAIDGIFASGMRPLVVGGSMMYLDSLLNGLSYLPDIDPNIIKKWDDLYCVSEKEQFYSMAMNLMGCKNISLDRYRLVRNLAMFEQTGMTLQQLYAKNERLQMIKNTEFTLLILNPEKNLVHESVDRRIGLMLERGLLSEVKAVIDAGLLEVGNGILGLVDFASHVTGKISLEQAIECFQKKSREYVRRQRSWAKNRFLGAKEFADKESLVDYSVGLLATNA